jgi:O-antigen ligase
MPSVITIYFYVNIVNAVLLIFGFVNPIFGMLSYFTAMMTRPGLYFPIFAKIRIELIIGLIVLFQIFISGKSITKKLSFSYDPTNKYMFLFFIVMLLSFFQALDWDVSWNNGVLEFIKIYVFYIMIMVIIEDLKDVKLFLWAFAVLTILTNYEGLYLYLTGTESYVFQGIDVAISSKGFSAGHVAAANMQLQALPVMIYLIIIEKRIPLKIFACVLASLSTIGVIASGSRGGYLGLLCIALLLVLYSKRKALTSLLITVSVLCLLPFMKGAYLSWMGSITKVSDVSAHSRIDGLINGIEMMIRRPILGVGPECYPLARKAWFGWGLDAHNQYGQLMGDLGICGTVIWTIFIVSVFKNLNIAKRIVEGYKEFEEFRLITIAMLISLIVRLFEGMFSHSLYVFFWYAMAALSVILIKIAHQTYESNTAFIEGMPKPDR